jgi:release factor glutamine methyltransferase
MDGKNESHGAGERVGRFRPSYRTATRIETTRVMLQRGAALLREHGVPNARLNAEWILCDALGCTRMDLFLGSADVPADDRARQYWRNIRRRAGREPLQYILGTTEFMSLPFCTPTDVFVPRPDTELLVELTEARLRRVPIVESLEILDLCCGTGAVVISLAARIPNLTAIAVDVSERATAVTKLNAGLNGVSGRVFAVGMEAATFLGAGGSSAAGSLPAVPSLEHSRRNRFAAIVCNPPYIESSQLENLPPEVRDYEPHTALDGGRDGLDFYRTIVPALPRWLRRGGFAAFEIGDSQGLEVGGMMRDAGFADVTVTSDYAGRDRVVVGSTPATSV